jgi:hypothetical protein
MPAGRQDSSLFYAVVVFVALFIVSTALAVIFYLKFTDYQKANIEADKKVQELASTREVKNLGSIVGTKEGRTVLGTMLTRFDTLTTLVLGDAPADMTAEAKLEKAKLEINAILSKIQVPESNSPSLIRALESLKSQYDDSQVQLAAANKKIQDMTQTADELSKAAIEKDKETGVYITKLQDDANKATKGYQDLKALMQQNADQQIAGLTTKLDKAEQYLKKQQDECRSLNAKLTSANDRINQVQGQLESIVPKPDNTTAAFKPDGKIISIDNATKTVFINLGLNDHVYRGLTFAVYDKSVPIPRDGKGKAKIEVFDVQQRVSAARIVQTDKGNPIMANDLIGNLIWDAKMSREFVVAGSFAFGDGTSSIKDLITKWGGTVADNVSINTSFVVLGTAPVMPQKPTVEMIEADPRAMDKYDKAVKEYNGYAAIIDQAKVLSIPVFSLERFLDFIGYSAPGK